MNRLGSSEDLDRARRLSEERISKMKCRILICAGTGCLAGGSQKIYEKMCELCGNDPDAEIGELPLHKEVRVAVVQADCVRLACA